MKYNKLLDKADTYPLRGICMLMIFFHHSYLRYKTIDFTSGGEFLLINKLYSVWHWGYLATGIFFFLSGFGLYYSIRKNSPLEYKWFVSHMRKLFAPFLFLFIVYIICFLIWNPNSLKLSMLYEFITLRSPGRETWFFQTIVGTYITTFFIFRHIANDKLRLPFLAGCTFIYAIIMAKYSTGPWWYNSIFCFPIGMTCAKYYSYIDKIPDYVVITLSLTAYILFYRYIGFDIMECISFSIFIIWIIKYIDIRSRYLHFVGVQSLSFYFLETPIKGFFCISLIDNYWLFTISSIVVTSVIALLYNYLQNRILTNHL